jgi:hypothetical protein
MLYQYLMSPMSWKYLPDYDGDGDLARDYDTYGQICGGSIRCKPCLPVSTVLKPWLRMPGCNDIDGGYDGLLRFIAAE